MRAVVAAGVLALSIGCEDSEPFDGPPDAAVVEDSGVPMDAGALDSGFPTDAGAVDSGLPMDAGAADGGVASGRRLRGQSKAPVRQRQPPLASVR
ncbi:MAG: hypothetical protein AAFV29_09210, partial [Myxococcota bacterium]